MGKPKDTAENQNIRQISRSYDPKQVEDKWYQFWLEKNFSTPKIDPRKKPFVIIMPPPNVTGELHLGHALTATIEDILTRWHRMKGDPTLWLPGVDHASIATQYVVQQNLANKGLDKQSLGREKFLELVWEWVNQCRNKITAQHKRLGVSCDWSREVFTMDEGPARAVRTTFVNLYNKGLIYQGERITNWCPACATVLSDLEVDHKETQGNLYHIKYRIAGIQNEYITVATTRPETLLGDTAVAVNPDDPRYKTIIGKKVLVPAVNREIPIIADSAVDTSFGTGALKVTPGHDPVDFEISQRRELPIINIMNLDATLNEHAGPYKNLDRFTCRKELLSDLKSNGLLVQIEPYVHSVGYCYRCSTMVEPLVTKQWFVQIAPLAKPAIDVVLEGKINIVPEHFTKVYLNWMQNIRDWCISRQLWWGHRIPVWYCRDCNEIIVAIEDPTSCASCNSSNIEQDPDVLDTWFSSGLWPHSTLGWPDEKDDYKYFYPTSVMETGYDILFFWVARMIMMGIENTGQIPFDTVYLHGLIRDENGEKMSKSKGNVIDPLVTMDIYGTDALRFSLTVGNTPGNDMRLSSHKLEGARNFTNKLWNASRFVIGNVEGHLSLTIPSNLLPEDRWILSRLNRTISDVESHLEEFQLGQALQKVYEFLWDEYCDWYIEIAKIRLRDTSAPTPLPVLVHVLEASLRLLHPFMPFITEEIWQKIKTFVPYLQTDSIMITSYPVHDVSFYDMTSEEEMKLIIEIIRSIRNTRAENKVDPAKYIQAVVWSRDGISFLENHQQTISSLARVRPLIFTDTKSHNLDKAKVIVLKDVEIMLPLEEMIDVDSERTRITKEIDEVNKEIARISKLLDDESFTSKAPDHIVEKERQKLNNRKSILSQLEERLSKLG